MTVNLFFHHFPKELYSEIVKHLTPLQRAHSFAPVCKAWKKFLDTQKKPSSLDNESKWKVGVKVKFQEHPLYRWKFDACQDRLICRNFYPDRGNTRAGFKSCPILEFDNSESMQKAEEQESFITGPQHNEKGDQFIETSDGKYIFHMMNIFPDKVLYEIWDMENSVCLTSFSSPDQYQDILNLRFLFLSNDKKLKLLDLKKNHALIAQIPDVNFLKGIKTFQFSEEDFVVGGVTGATNVSFPFLQFFRIRESLVSRIASPIEAPYDVSFIKDAPWIIFCNRQSQIAITDISLNKTIFLTPQVDCEHKEMLVIGNRLVHIRDVQRSTIMLAPYFSIAIWDLTKIAKEGFLENESSITEFPEKNPYVTTLKPMFYEPKKEFCRRHYLSSKGNFFAVLLPAKTGCILKVINAVNGETCFETISQFNKFDAVKLGNGFVAYAHSDEHYHQFLHLGHITSADDESIQKDEASLALASTLQTISDWLSNFASLDSIFAVPEI